MRHRVHGRTLNRNTKARAGLLKSLARELVEHGSITTTEAKAKELKRLADKLMSTALKNSLVARRTLHRFFGKRDIVNTLVDRIAPALKSRKSGFTTLTRLDLRAGDNTQMMKIAWVEEAARVSSLQNPEPKPVRAKKPKTVAAKSAPAPTSKAKAATKKATPAKAPKKSAKKAAAKA